MKCIGYEISERLARRASSYYVKVIKRAKYADPADPLKGVQTACPSADSFGQENGKTKYDVSFIAGIAVDKVENHLPLYRQAEIMNREGLMINRSTLQHLFTKTAEFLTPLYDRMGVDGNAFLDGRNRDNGPGDRKWGGKARSSLNPYGPPSKWIFDGRAEGLDLLSRLACR